MKKWEVRYTVDGFVEKETFSNKKDAYDYYHKIAYELADYLTELHIYEYEGVK